MAGSLLCKYIYIHTHTHTHTHTFVLGVVTCLLCGYLNNVNISCFDVSHVTTCLFIKNVLLFCYHWNYALTVVFMTFGSYFLFFAHQYVNFLDPTAASLWMKLTRCNNDSNPKTQRGFTIFDVVFDYPLNEVNFMMTSGTYEPLTYVR